MQKKLKLSILLLTTLMLMFNFNLSNSYANVNLFEDIDMDEQERIYQEIIKDLPTATVSDSDYTPFSIPAYVPKAGDILYTPSTQCKNDPNICKGISGHVGIVVSDAGAVIHTAGKGKLPTLIPLTTWYKSYAETTVVRPNNATRGKNAADWARNYYGTGGAGSKKTYAVTINSDLSKTLSLNTTYCSLLVWQAYYFGANQFLSLGDPVVPVLFVNYAGYHDMRVLVKL